jgi:hypothetical protein
MITDHGGRSASLMKLPESTTCRKTLMLMSASKLADAAAISFDGISPSKKWVDPSDTVARETPTDSELDIEPIPLG